MFHILILYFHLNHKHLKYLYFFRIHIIYFYIILNYLLDLKSQIFKEFVLVDLPAATNNPFIVDNDLISSIDDFNIPLQSNVDGSYNDIYDP